MGRAPGIQPRVKSLRSPYTGSHPQKGGEETRSVAEGRGGWAGLTRPRNLLSLARLSLSPLSLVTLSRSPALSPSRFPALSGRRPDGQGSGDTTSCKVTPSILHGVVSPEGRGGDWISGANRANECDSNRASECVGSAGRLGIKPRVG